MIRRGLVWVLTKLVRGYQLVVSPWFAPSCRYYPTCSAYAIDALKVHGPFRGVTLAIWRLLRCNPWSKGGIDHVPEPGQWRGSSELIDSGRSQTPEEDSSTSQRTANTSAGAPPAWRSLHGNL